MAQKTAIVCNGREPGNVYPVFILGSAAAALGNEVILFFTPAGADVLKKGVIEQIKVEGMPDLTELVKGVRELKGRICLCELALEGKGLKKEDLRDGVEIVGATSFMAEIQDAQITLSF